MAAYESDLTRFMRSFLDEHPEEIESQRKGRAIWWDKDPSVRTQPKPAHTSPRSGGAEYTFKLPSDIED
jgi:hypothetical protein